MLNQTRRNLAGAALVAGAIGATGVAAIAGGNGTESRAPLSCSIEVTQSGGMIALESRVAAVGETAGAYRLTVAGGGTAGRTSINQGGGFIVRPGENTMLGRVMLTAGGAYEVRLEIDSALATIVCTRDIAGAI